MKESDLIISHEKVIEDLTEENIRLEKELQNLNAKVANLEWSNMTLKSQIRMCESLIKD